MTLTDARAAERPICPPDHRHGAARTCYKLHRCGCDACRTANRDAERRRTRAHLYGRFDSGLVDAEPVREHLRYLSANGIGYKRVAVLAGVSRTGVRSILFGRQDPGPRHGEMPARCAREKAERILALRVDFANLAPGARVSARGAQRRVQALVAIGWTQTAIAERLGMRVGNLSAMLRQEQILAARHLQVAALYDELWNQRPARDTFGWKRATRVAERHGWVPPLAWDDIDQDPHPPTADEVDVDELAVEHAVAGHAVPLTRAERLEAVARLTTAGRPASHVAEVVGITERQVVRDLATHRAQRESA